MGILDQLFGTSANKAADEARRASYQHELDILLERAGIRPGAMMNAKSVPASKLGMTLETLLVVSHALLSRIEQLERDVKQK
jgi:hypothetical protein